MKNDARDLAICETSFFLLRRRILYNATHRWRKSETSLILQDVTAAIAAIAIAVQFTSEPRDEPPSTSYPAPMRAFAGHFMFLNC